MKFGNGPWKAKCVCSVKDEGSIIRIRIWEVKSSWITKENKVIDPLEDLFCAESLYDGNEAIGNATK